MEFNSGINMVLPDSIGLTENDFDDHEQTNQNEIVELIMAAFDEHDEPSDDESLNTSDSTDLSLSDQQIFDCNNIDEQQNELNNQNSSKDTHGFEINDSEDNHTEIELPNDIVFYPNPNHTSSPTPDIHKLRILCNAKERKICQFEELCEKYETDIEIFRNKIELNEKSKYDLEQRYELISTQCKDLIEKNNQLHRTVKDTQLFKSKLHDSELLIDSLYKKINDYESLLTTTREKLEIENKTNEQILFQRMETINHLNDELHDYQQKYNNSITNQTELKQELARITDEKEKLEFTYLEIQSEIRTLRENDFNNTILSIQNHDKTSLLDENIQLKERIEELQRKVFEYEYKSQRSDSDSSNSSNGSSKTVIRTSAHKEQLKNLTNQIEKLKKDYADLEEKYEYEKHELQTMIEQLKEDVSELDKTKQLYNDICQEKRSIEDALRSQFEFDLKSKTDNLYRILKKEYHEKLEFHKNNQDVTLQLQFNQDLDQQTNELHQEMHRIKVKYEKQILELNDEIQRLSNNDHVKKGYEALKHDYNNLSLKHKQLLNTCSTLENENKSLLNSIDEIDQDRYQLKETFKHEEEKLLNEIKQLNELNEHQKQELLSIHKQTDYQQIHLKKDIESLQLRINNYENAISQYEEYRLKLETNLQKLTQQRDIHKTDLRLTQEMLANKEEECNQLKIRCEEYEKHLQINKERFIPYETTINDLQRQIQELNQTRLTDIQDTEVQYREKLIALETEKCQLENQLQQANRTVNLADSHLQKEIEKIKISLEQEYNRRYERDYKQHQQDLLQLRQQLTSEIDKQPIIISPLNLSNNSLQDTEEVKKMYRTEIDRLYRENIELSQHQAKLIDTHQKQIQIMKKELDDGYNNVINEFQREQTRLQTRYDQLKQQLTIAQHTIEQLKSNFNQLKTNHFDDISKVKEAYTIEYDHKTRKDNLQQRLENLVKLLEQSNDALIQERTVHAKQENEYQQTITSLQMKIDNMIKHHTRAVEDIKRELQYERSINQKRVPTRPISVPDFTQTDSISHNLTTIEKLRELFTAEMLALLRLLCKMIFDVHHKIITGRYLDNIELSIKKQIQNELIRSRNSMIKDFRREIFEKMTKALRSQGVPDRTIDMHIFELDRLLSQMAQDCLDSLTTSSQSLSNSSVFSFPSTLQNSSSTKTLTKSVECLYMSPIMSKPPLPFSPNNRRPKSASNVLIATQYSTPVRTISSPYVHRFQQSTHRNCRIKMCRSEDDIMLAMQRIEQERVSSDSDDDETLTLCETEDEIHQIKLKQNHSYQEEIAEKRLSSTPIPSTQKNGIKKFVQNGLKLFIPQPQQQHKKSGK